MPSSVDSTVFLANYLPQIAHNFLHAIINRQHSYFSYSIFSRQHTVTCYLQQITHNFLYAIFSRQPSTSCMLSSVDSTQFLAWYLHQIVHHFCKLSSEDSSPLGTSCVYIWPASDFKSCLWPTSQKVGKLLRFDLVFLFALPKVYVYLQLSD